MVFPVDPRRPFGSKAKPPSAAPRPAECGEALVLLQEASARMRGAPAEFAERLAFVLGAEGLALFSAITDPDIAREAGDHLAVFGPTDFLRRLVAAMRAGDFDLAILDDFVLPRDGLCAFDAAAMNAIEGRD